MIAITKYSYSLPTFPGFNEWKKNIKLFNNDKLIADVRFVEDAQSLQNLVNVNPDGASQVYVSEEEFPFWIDTLRNEKPLFVHHYPSSKRILLSTASEPVGEGGN